MKPKTPAPAVVTRNVGNCQVCEGDFKATPGGVLALHGYTRPGDGHVEGRCPGEGELAYERSRDLIPPIVEGFKREEAAHRRVLRAIDDGTVASFFKESWSLRDKPVEVKRSEVPEAQWRYELKQFRDRNEIKLERAAESRKHYERRYDGWSLRPLREVDELGRTPEQKRVVEARKEERGAAREAKADKARRLAQERGEKLLERKRVLDEAGALIRSAAARNDRDGVLAILKTLGKKKNESLLNPSFAIYESVKDLRRRGTIPPDLPDIGNNEAYYWSWEHDLGVDDVLLKMGFANHESGRPILRYDESLWRA